MSSTRSRYPRACRRVFLLVDRNDARSSAPLTSSLMLSRNLLDVDFCGKYAVFAWMKSAVMAGNAALSTIRPTSAMSGVALGFDAGASKPPDSSTKQKYIGPRSNYGHPERRP